MPMEGSRIDISDFTSDQLIQFIKGENNDRETKLRCFKKLIQAEGQEQVKSRIPE